MIATLMCIHLHSTVRAAECPNVHLSSVFSSGSRHISRPLRASFFIVNELNVQAPDHSFTAIPPCILRVIGDAPSHPPTGDAPLHPPVMVH